MINSISIHIDDDGPISHSEGWRQLNDAELGRAAAYLALMHQKRGSREVRQELVKQLTIARQRIQDALPGDTLPVRALADRHLECAIRILTDYR
jgi:hypothetical protein